MQIRNDLLQEEVNVADNCANNRRGRVKAEQEDHEDEEVRHEARSELEHVKEVDLETGVLSGPVVEEHARHAVRQELDAHVVAEKQEQD